MSDIIVYTKKKCKFCVMAKMTLSSRGIPFTEQLVGQDIVREDFISLFPDVKTLPQIVIDGVRIGGHKELKEMVDTINTDDLLLG